MTTSTNATLAGLLGTELNTTAETTGGGLFNTNGELVGILTSPSGVSTTGLAVPIRVADDVRDQIESSGKVTHGWLGLTADDAKDRAGATITSVVADSPAAAAKLEVGDVITQAGGQFIGGFDDLVAEWRRHRPGDSIAISYRRGRSVVLAVRPGDADGSAVRSTAAGGAGCRAEPLGWLNCRGLLGPRDDEGMTVAATPGEDELEDLDRELLNAVQWDFPLVPRPYAALG